MLFSRREPLTPIGPSFTQRFSSKLGQYLAPSHPDDVKRSKHKPTLNIDACYALLGEKTKNNEYNLADLQDQLEKLTQHYQNKTGKYLEREQFALAALRIDANKQAEQLKHHLLDQDFTDCTLVSESSTSPLHLALLSDALNINNFSDKTTKPAAPEFKACRHMLNISLNDVSMQDLESYCRTLRESCSEAMAGRGIDTESLLSSWQLRMRYNKSENTLLLKCMPIDMLRDTFQRQYIETFGQTPSNQEIIIEALEVTVHSEDDVESEAPSDSTHVEDYMQSWQSTNTDSNVLWSKQISSETLDSQTEYLNCPVLNKMVESRVGDSTDSKISDFFIQKV